ncbi:MAG: CpaF family protein [Acidimicrobiia bacterium]
MSSARAPVHDPDRALRRSVHQRLVGSEAVEQLVGVPAFELRRRLGDLLHEADPLLSTDRHERLVRELADEVAGLGPLEPLLADPSVTEVMVNGALGCFVERAGRLEQVPLTLDDSGLMRIVERIIAPLGLRLDRASPMVDARLADGSRLHAVIPPLAIDGTCVTIRRFGARAIALDEFTPDERAAAFLRWAVSAGWNVLVSGGTSSGKTTLLNAMSAAIDPNERIITIEETAELRLMQPHVARLEARPPNAEGAGAVSVRDLVRTALRMRPDRLVVGEVRGAEALDLLQALNTGHEGALSTVHANSPLDALRRIATLSLFGGVALPYEAITDQVAAAVDLVVQVERARGGSRRIVAIAEVATDRGTIDVRPVFALDRGELRPLSAPTRASRRRDAPAPDGGWFE